MIEPTEDDGLVVQIPVINGEPEIFPVGANSNDNTNRTYTLLTRDGRGAMKGGIARGWSMAARQS